ncbi:MAG: AraC family transcriptional regulator [Polyangiales bacterium]
MVDKSSQSRTRPQSGERVQAHANASVAHDALTAALACVRLRGAVFGRGALARDWGVASPGLPHILFLVLGGGSAHLTLRVRRRVERVIAPGDTLVLRAGTPFELRAHRATPVIAFEQYLARMARVQPTAATSVLCGSVELDAAGEALFGASLPPVIQLAAASGAARGLTGALVAEVAQPRAASALVQTRLAELLFLEALRLCVEAEPVGPARVHEPSGWLRGLRHPAIAHSLAAIHGAPERAWTVETLAECAGMSRSTFARTFRAATGATPLAHLASWRMQLAAQKLHETTESLEVIAQQAGYTSDEAFSRAFRAWAGMPPGRYRRDGRR